MIEGEDVIACSVSIFCSNPLHLPGQVSTIRLSESLSPNIQDESLAYPFNELLDYVWDLYDEAKERGTAFDCGISDDVIVPSSTRLSTRPQETKIVTLILCAIPRPTGCCRGWRLVIWITYQTYSLTFRLQCVGSNIRKSSACSSMRTTIRVTISRGRFLRHLVTRILPFQCGHTCTVSTSGYLLRSSSLPHPEARSRTNICASSAVFRIQPPTRVYGRRKMKSP